MGVFFSPLLRGYDNAVTKWRRQGDTLAYAEATMRIAYSKVQIKRKFFHKSLVLKRLRVSSRSRLFLSRPLGLPPHMLTVITLDSINSGPVALPSRKELGQGLAPSSLATFPTPTSARLGITVNVLNSNPDLAAAILFSLLRTME